MVGRRSASVGLVQASRNVLTPIAARHGIDYDESTFLPPSTMQELAFEAVRSCTGLLRAFAYPDAWPGENRAERKLGKRAAAMVGDSFQAERGCDAVAWAAIRFGQVMAELRRRSAETRDPNEADAFRDTADADERLSGLVSVLWPVDPEQPALVYARTLSTQPFMFGDAEHALIDLHAHEARAAATVEMLSLATWPATPDIEALVVTALRGIGLEFFSGVLSDWSVAGERWANLIGPHPVSFSEVNDIIEAKQDD